MKKTLYYWRGLTEVSPELLPALRSRGIEVIEKSSLEEILDDAPQDDPTVIVVDASGGEREASERVLELRSAVQLQMLPVVFISPQASKRCEPLERSFYSLIPATMPLKTEALVKAIELVVNHPETASEVAEFLRALSGGSWPTLKNSTSTSEISTTEATSPEADPALNTQGSELAQKNPPSNRLKDTVRWIMEDNDQKILERIRHFSDPSKLEASYGGVVFSLARNEAHFTTEVLLPLTQYGEATRKHLEELSQKDSWLAAQASRVAFTSSALAKAIKLETTSESLLQLSALFLNWGLARAPVELHRYDLIRYPSADIKHMLCYGFNESATFLDQSFPNSAGSLIREMISSLKSNSNKQDSKDNLSKSRQHAAQILLGAEISARACWGKGYWDPQGANRAIRFIRRETNIFSDRRVSQALCRLLGEAVTTHVTVHNTYNPSEKILDQKNKLRPIPPSTEITTTPATELLSAKGYACWSQKVAICDITPGMLLTAPVLARDGRVVVGANVRLSEEIVLDLWQLAAVRALGSSVHIAICPY